MPSCAARMPAFSSFGRILAIMAGETPCSSARSRLLAGVSRDTSQSRQWIAYSTAAPYRLTPRRSLSEESEAEGGCVNITQPIPVRVISVQHRVTDVRAFLE